MDSLESFEAAMAALVENGVTEPLSYATADAGTTYRVFYTLFSQMGGELITDGEVLAGDNADKAVQAIEIMARWRETAGFRSRPNIPPRSRCSPRAGPPFIGTVSGKCRP